MLNKWTIREVDNYLLYFFFICGYDILIIVGGEYFMENNKGSKKFVFVSENDKNSKPEVVKTKIKSSKTLEYNIDKGFYFGFKL